METDHSETLAEVFAEVLESLAFMFVDDPDEDEPFEPDGGAILAVMKFTGPFNGELAIAAPDEMCPELAANVLGLEPDDEIVQANPYDALKELLNVACGNLLTAIAGDEPVFDLTPPEVAPMDAAAWNAMKEAGGAVPFLVDDQPVLLRLTTSE